MNSFNQNNKMTQVINESKISLREPIVKSITFLSQHLHLTFLHALTYFDPLLPILYTCKYYYLLRENSKQ